MESRNKFMQILLILTLIYYSSAEVNKLEVTKCLVKKLDKAEVVSAGSSSILKSEMSRSLLSCVDLCLSHVDCYGALYSDPQRSDLLGECFLLDAHYESGWSRAASPATVTGKLVSVVKSSPPEAEENGDSTCSDVTCTEGAVCYHLCDQGSTTSYPYCIADNFDCDLDEEYTNVRHYWTSRSKNDQDDGVFQFVTYNKTRSDSAVRVVFSSSFGGHLDDAGKCSRFYVTFDGEECNNPIGIERVSYNNRQVTQRRSHNIDGTCYGLPEGPILVELNTGVCGEYGSTDSDVGYKNSRHLILMEIIPHTATPTKPCPGLSVFNYQYDTSSTLSSSLIGYDHDIFTSNTYRKLANDTGLRVKFQAALRLFFKEEERFCARWAMFVDDDVECSPVGDTVIYCDSDYEDCVDHARNMYQTHTLEAVCENLTAGEYNITIKVVQCTIATTADDNPETSSGWYDGLRMHIEEIRSNQRLDAALSSDGRILKNAYQNVYMFYSDGMPATGVREGQLLSFDYTKNNELTVLRLTSSGTHKSTMQSGKSNPCSRWYFEVNGAACSVEGIAYFDHHVNLVYPMHGICNSPVPAGLVTISYNVGNCPSESDMGYTTTGRAASFHIFVEEVSLQSQKTCDAADPVDCDD